MYYTISTETTTSRQVTQTQGWARVIDKLKEIVQYELAPAPTTQYRQKLNKVIPSSDCSVDNATANSTQKDIVVDMIAGLKMGSASSRAVLSHPAPSLSTVAL